MGLLSDPVLMYLCGVTSGALIAYCAVRAGEWVADRRTRQAVDAIVRHVQDERPSSIPPHTLTGDDVREAEALEAYLGRLARASRATRSVH